MQLCHALHTITNTCFTYAGNNQVQWQKQFRLQTQYYK